MPRRSHHASGEFVFHVFNRAIQDLTLFEAPADYDAFLRLLCEAKSRVPIRLLAYVVMPNHWHLVLWPPGNDSLSPFMRWLCGTHAQRWRVARRSAGRGAVYQGRYKAVAVQTDHHLLRLCRYVERNPLRASLVRRAEHWPWSSASALSRDTSRPPLETWPVEKPEGWLTFLNEPEPRTILDEIREALRRGAPLGSSDWRVAVAARLGWRCGLRSPGRPQSTPGSKP